MSSETKQPFAWHGTLERNVTILAICAFLAVIVGGLVEIVPLFYIDNTIEKVKGVRPYTRWNRPVATSTSAKGAICATAR
jgi:cytochrome c oxidase cbb3-type subunit 2